jgi:hypothetical protein
MSRAVRTARGASGALIATVLAAASHGLAGGTSTPLAVIATAVLALPLCVLLAGRVGSLWRLAVAVVPAQFAFHWTFAGLGLASSTPGAAAEVVSPHAAHLGLVSFSPSLVAAGAADSLMWVSHAVAAAITIALMHWGELAAMHLARALRRTAPLPRGVVRLPQHRVIRVRTAPIVTSLHRGVLSTISHRGPPRVSFSH